MKRIFFFLIAVLMMQFAGAQGFSKAEYFFDADPEINNGTQIALTGTSDTINFSSVISTASLSTGFHFLGLRVKHNDGTWGLFEKRGFYISVSASDAANITAAEYFFDADPGIGNATPTSVGASGSVVNFTAVIPISLPAGFHFLSIRVKGTDGIWGLFEKRGFYISASTSDATDITAAEYFFDADPGVGNGTSTSVGSSGGVVNFTTVIPTSLAAGFHFLSIRVKGTDGIWGLYDKRGFYISPSTSDAANILAAEYFFDADPGIGNATPTSVGASGSVVNFTAVIPTLLSTGFHFLSIRVKGADGIWGLYDKRGFYISSAAVDAANIVAAEYFFDADPGIGNGTTTSVGTSDSVVNFTAVIPTSLSPGFHFLSIRTKGVDGVWGLFEKRGFYISTATANMPIITVAEYFYDSDPGIGNGQPLTINSPGDTVIQTFSIPVPGTMTNGQHFLAIRVKDQGGNWGLYDFDTLTIGVSTITCPTNATANTAAGQCTSTINNIDPTITPSQPYTYTFSGATTGGGSGSASGQIFNAGTTTVTYTLTFSPTTNCSFTVIVNALPPTISSQPASQIVCTGSNVTFSVTATGTGLTYQWRKNTVNIPGATSASYTINGATPGDAGNYDVVVTSSCNTTVTSNTAILTVNSGASITSQPASQTVCAGTNVTFSITATGTGLTYQWRKNTVNIPGATSSSYTIIGATPADAANYDVVVTGSCGTITSNTAILTVNPITVINTQPAAQIVCAGNDATFNVSASGTALTYQWRKNTVIIPGATSSSYTVTGATAGDAGNYDVVVTGTCGTVTSSVVTLTVNPITAITTQPASQTVCAGVNVTFSVTAVGASLTYQWRKNTVNIPGATSSSYTITGAAAGDAGSYDVVVSGSCGTATSNAATLSINAVTVINTQPSSQTVCAGNSATFTVAATGTSITYQWRKNSANIPGATSSSYTITGATAGDAGSYDVVVTGICGTATSIVATLTVNAITAITTQPVSQTVCAGTNVTFSVTAAGASLTYQWRKNTVNIPGATSSSYTITGATAGDAGSYDVVVSGSCGTATSNAATLSINAATVISTQPASQTVCAGSNVSFSVTANGTSITYQWRKAGVNISGATSSTFAITGATAGDAGNYDVVVTGTCGVATSSTAILIVNAAGTWLGVTSTDWNTSSNWCGGVPTSTTDVIVPSSAANMPNLSNGTGAARNITINFGGALTLGSAGSLDLYGSVINSGTFNATAGNINFRGSSSQSMPAFTTTNVTMNGNGGVVLGGNTIINGTLTLTNGNISLGTNNLTLAASSTGSISSHIITNGSGNVILKSFAASTTRTVPVAVNATGYNPVVIAANTGHITDDITVRVVQGVLSNGLTGTSFTDKVVDKTWIIDEVVAGGSNVNVTLQWAGSQELTGFDRNKCYVMQHTGGTWVIGTSTAASGADPYTQTKTNITSFSPFAVQTQPIPRPSTGIFPNPVSSQLNIVIDLPNFEPIAVSVYDAAGKLVMQKFTALNGGVNLVHIYVDRLSAGTYTLKISTSRNSKFMVATFVKY
jgi:hypothetical protein